MQGKYAILFVRRPGSDYKPAGVLLCDSSDRLYVQLSERLASLDPDDLEYWAALQEDIENVSAEKGGGAVLEYLYDVASHFIQISDIVGCEFETPEAYLEFLFAREVVAKCFESLSKRADLFIRPRYSLVEISQAVSNLPVSPSSAAKLIQLWHSDEDVAWHLEQILNRDPVLAAEIVKVANITKFARAGEIRSVRQAIFQMGTEKALGLLMGMTFRRVFSSDSLRKIWRATRVSVEALTSITLRDPIDGLILAGVLHDIGKLILHLLPGYSDEVSRLTNEGFDEVTAEHLLCGLSHSGLGADLLRDWGLRDELVEAIRFHHTPSKTDSKGAAYLFLAETFSGDMDNTSYDLYEYEVASKRVSQAYSDYLRLFEKNRGQWAAIGA